MFTGKVGVEGIIEHGLHLKDDMIEMSLAKIAVEQAGHESFLDVTMALAMIYARLLELERQVAGVADEHIA